MRECWIGVRLVFIFSILMVCSVLKAENNSPAYWNFNNVDIKTIIEAVAEQTQKNFIVDPRVQGKVTVISQAPIQKKDIYELFLTILQVHGYGAIETGNIVKILPSEQANSGETNLDRNFKQTLPVIKIFPLKYIAAPDMLISLKALMPKSSKIIAHADSNHIIVIDNSNQMSKYAAILEKLDVPSAHLIDVVSVKYASSTDIANVLLDVIRQKKNLKNNVSISADDRTNNILLSSGTKEMRDQIKQAIRSLDVQTDNTFNSEVVYLKYVEARNIAPIIATFMEDASAATKEDEKSTTVRPSLQANNSSTSTSPIQRQHLRALKSNSEYGTGQGMLFDENENRPKSGVENKYVQWEELTNSLIIKGSPSLIRSAKSIVAKLDIRRPQVLIEVIIAEINLNRVSELGVEWGPSASSKIKFGTRFHDSANDANHITGGFFDGVVERLGSGLSVGVFQHGNLRALVKALASDTSANILSTPTLVTLDNQTALIKVGEKVPFAVGQTNNDNIDGNPFTSFDREEVGLSLAIKPQITRSGAVKLQIENILSNVIPNSGADDRTGGNPTTSERTIVTNVIVDDGKILVLGGLIQNSWEDVESRVPVVGRVPLFGNLFKNKTKRLVKKNLMVFLRPIVMKDDAMSIHQSTLRYDRFRTSQLNSYYANERTFVDEPNTLNMLDETDYHPSSQPQGRKKIHQKDRVVLPEPFELKNNIFKQK